jgi:energy-coupling factor transport system ATP-binding protein
MIEFTNVTYTYPHSARPALDGVSLRIAPGEFVLLAGPSGSGKSTLLRCLNGLVPHFSGGVIGGQVCVHGLDALALGPRVLSRHVGFVQQSPEAQAVLDRVEPEIAFALENTAVPPTEMRLRVEEALGLLELAPLRNRLLTTLSGGERQRVAIAAALALRPHILALDEPTSQLDPQSAADVLRALVRLNEDLGLTIVLAEHRLERVLRYADRLVYLQEGRVVVDGPVRAALAQAPQLPPLVRLGRELGWTPLPLTVKEARPFAQAASPPSPPRPVAPSPPRPSQPPLLVAANLRFAYNGAPALRGVSLQVYPGEAVALMGRNGVGKSTLLNCLMGLLRVREGEVRINGRSIHGRDVADIAREVAYLPQNPDDLLFAESATEELEITLRNHKLSHLDGVQQLLGQLGLADVAAAYPRDLSVGQRQRVALGAVTITRPRLLLLDEPTRGLDYAAKQSLIAIWRRWLADGMGLLLVTHDVELAAQIADRALILSEGELIAEGPTAEILGASPLFAPQIARLFPNSGWLTVEDALAVLK